MFKKFFISLTISSLISIPAIAATQKLPFIGERHYNFMGGSGTDEFIIIKKNGMAYYGGTGDLAAGGTRMIDRKVRFKNPDCDAESCTRFTTTTVEMLDKNMHPIYQCSERGIFYGEDGDADQRHRCIQNLTRN